MTFLNIFVIFPRIQDLISCADCLHEDCLHDGNNLHEMSNPDLWENKKNINLSSAKYSQRVVKVKCCYYRSALK